MASNYPMRINEQFTIKNGDIIAIRYQPESGFTKLMNWVSGDKLYLCSGPEKEEKLRPAKVTSEEFPEECIFRVMVNDKQFTEIKDYMGKTLYLHQSRFSKTTKVIASGSAIGFAGICFIFSPGLIPVGLLVGAALPIYLRGKTVDFRFKQSGSADDASFTVDRMDASQCIVNLKCTNMKDYPIYWLCENDCVKSCGSDLDKNPPSKFVLETVPQSV